MLRSESWPSWGVGLALGAAAGYLVLLGGLLFLALGAACLALAFVVARSAAFLSGALLGMGGLWSALMARAQLACDAFDAAPGQGCQAFGVGQFLLVAAVVVSAGLLLGALAWRRRNDRDGGQAGS